MKEKNDDARERYFLTSRRKLSEGYFNSRYFVKGFSTSYIAEIPGC